MATRAVLDAMRAVDRRDFLPPDLRGSADGDYPLSIGHGQTNSQPSTVRAMLDLLDVGEGMRVLDVGAGSGWTTALLARLVGSGGAVIGVELEPSIAVWGAANLADQEAPWARIDPAQPGVLGWPDDGPYDRILVSAAAKSVPRALVGQLGADGVMVLVVSGRLLRMERSGGDEPVVTEHGSYRFVPLR